MVGNKGGYALKIYRMVDEVRREAFSRVVGIVEELVRAIDNWFGREFNDVAKKYGVIMVLGVYKDSRDLRMVTPIIQVVGVDFDENEKRKLRSEIRKIMNHFYSDSRIKIEFVKLPTIKTLFYYGENAKQKINQLEKKLGEI